VRVARASPVLPSSSLFFPLFDSFIGLYITKPYTPSKLEVTPKESENKDKGKTFAKEFPKQLDGKRCFKSQGYGHFQADCRNRMALTLKQIEEIDHLASELIEEEEAEEEATTASAPDVGEMLVLQMILHTKESGRRKAKGSTSFIPSVLSKGRCVA